MQELDQTGSNWMGELVQTAKTSSYHEQHSVDCHRFPCRDWFKLVQTCWENWFKLVHTAQTSSYWLCMQQCEKFKLLKLSFCQAVVSVNPFINWIKLVQTGCLFKLVHTAQTSFCA